MMLRKMKTKFIVWYVGRKGLWITRACLNVGERDLALTTARKALEHANRFNLAVRKDLAYIVQNLEEGK